MTDKPQLLPCFRCHQSDGLWIADEPSDPPELRYQVICVCGLMGLPNSSPETAAAWWNEGRDVKGK